MNKDDFMFSAEIPVRASCGVCLLLCAPGTLPTDRDLTLGREYLHLMQIQLFNGTFNLK